MNAHKPLLPNIDQLLRLLPDGHAFRILCVCGDMEKARFLEVQARCGINSRTLTIRLQHLVANGLLIRTRRRAAPPRVEYSLSAKGREWYSRLLNTFSPRNVRPPGNRV